MRRAPLAKAMQDPRFAQSIADGNALMRKKRPVPTEAQEQSAVVQWWDMYARSKGSDPRLLFAIPNGAFLAGDAQRRAIQMNNLKKSGLRIGVPDLFLAVCTKYGLGLFIEMKRTQHGKLSKEQAEMCQLLKIQNYRVIVCEGADAAIASIQNYLA